MRRSLWLLAILLLVAASVDAQRARARRVRAPPPHTASGSFYYTGTLRQPTCSDASIDSAISSSVSGDIVRMASACSSMTVSINIPSTKGILFDGNGSTFNSSSTLTVSANATTHTRVTNFTLACHDNAVTPNGGTGTVTIRLDHFTLTGSDLNGCVEGAGTILVDHLTATELNATDESFHWYGANTPCTVTSSSYSECGWSTALTPGDTQGVIYVEDSTIARDESDGNPGWNQSYYGARNVFRFNAFTGIAIDIHGTAGMVGGRWWEVYHNSFAQGPGTWNRRITNMRAGSGIIFANTKDVALFGYGVCEEDTGYPAAYQIGRGQSGALVPAYFFGDSLGVGGCSDANNNGTVTSNTDYYTSVGASCTGGGACTTGVGTGTSLPTTCTTGVGFWKTNEGEWWAANAGNDGVLYTCTSTDTWTLYYTPYTYPHPLQAGLEPDK